MVEIIDMLVFYDSLKKANLRNLVKHGIQKLPENNCFFFKCIYNDDLMTIIIFYIMII